MANFEEMTLLTSYQKNTFIAEVCTTNCAIFYINFSNNYLSNRSSNSGRFHSTITRCRLFNTLTGGLLMHSMAIHDNTTDSEFIFFYLILRFTTSNYQYYRSQYITFTAVNVLKFIARNHEEKKKWSTRATR